MKKERESINHSSLFFSSVRRSDQKRRPETISKMSDLFTATTAAEVEETLARGENIEHVQRDDDGESTPLESACKRGELEVVDCLLNHGAHPNNPLQAWKGPIQIAAREGHVNIIERLVRAGADINDNRGPERDTPLIVASGEGHVDVVDYLLSLGANIDCVDVIEATPLMWASINGHVDVVDRLLAAGCNVNAVDSSQEDALMWASVEITSRSSIVSLFTEPTFISKTKTEETPS